jgi:pyrimidine-specific ribonucleoside hydrolase
MRLIIDADPGNGIPGADIDDSVAIALALHSPEVSLEAITVVGGNVPVERGVECTLEILHAAGVSDVPVHRGATQPLVQDPEAWRQRLRTRRDDPRAQELWREVARPGPTSGAVHPTPAGQALVDLVNARPGEMTVVCIGPLTNVATAMLIDPDWAAKVGQIVMMAGAFDMPNVLHELNAAYDPEATHVVINSSAPILLLPLDVTTRTFLHLADVDRLAAAGTPLASYLARTVRPWVQWLAERFHRDGCFLHDPLVLAALLDPSLISTRLATVGVELHGSLTRGRMVAWDRDNAEILEAGLKLPTSVRPVTIATDVAGQRFTSLLVDRLTQPRAV